MGRAKGLRVHLMSTFNTPDVSAVLSKLGDLLAAGEPSPEIA